jgi:UDP-N-acetylglucosamine--N-acetylmuramyl-(pentapeptide) pyrophosphoryl-undecaprenol N-acetylglucosamine transferase
MRTVVDCMRIYFAPCGIALGHAGRCIPVAKTFVKRGHSVYFSTYGEAVPFVRKAGFQVGEVPALKFFESEDGTFNIKRTFAHGPRDLMTFSSQVSAELNFIEHFKPDLVISDSRLSTVLAARMRRIIPVLILHQLRIMMPHKKPVLGNRAKLKRAFERTSLEVLGSMWKLSKVIIVPDFPAPYTIAKANVVPSNQYLKKLKLVGPIVPKYPDELPAAEEIKRSLGLDDRPLILAAISGTIAEKKLIAGKLTEIFKEFPDRYNIVLTRGLSEIPNPPDTPEMRNKRLRAYNWISDRYSYLKACDILVTRGGHNTVAEAIYFGKPMVVVPTPAHSEHQGIAESLVKMGLGVSIQQQNLTKDELLGGVESIAGSTTFMEKVKDAQRFAMHYNAIESIYKTVCDVLKAPY